MLKQRVQWRLTHLPELVEKLRGLVKKQINEADRALIGVGDVRLRREYANFHEAKAEWRCVSERQKQRARDACLRIIQPTEQSRSTDGDLTVTYRTAAGKKMNQRKRARVERTNSSQQANLPCN